MTHQVMNSPVPHTAQRTGVTQKARLFVREEIHTLQERLGNMREVHHVAHAADVSFEIPRVQTSTCSRPTRNALTFQHESEIRPIQDSRNIPPKVQARIDFDRIDSHASQSEHNDPSDTETLNETHRKW